MIPDIDDIVRFLDPPLLDATLFQLGRNNLGIGNVGDLPLAVEAPMVERAAQVIALHRAVDAKMRAKMRALSLWQEPMRTPKKGFLQH